MMMAYILIYIYIYIIFNYYLLNDGEIYIAYIYEEDKIDIDIHMRSTEILILIYIVGR